MIAFPFSFFGTSLDVAFHPFFSDKVAVSATFPFPTRLNLTESGRMPSESLLSLHFFRMDLGVESGLSVFLISVEIVVIPVDLSVYFFTSYATS